MKITLTDTGKKFGSEWIFRNLTHTFESGCACAILGKNGSGKSTLLQLISGNLHPSEGTVRYHVDGREIGTDSIFRYLMIAAPYLELIEEFTLEEMLRFHFSFKRMVPGHSLATVRDLLGFSPAAGKILSQFSSGMKQRLRLVLAFLSDVPLLLLDEPTTNLDRPGMEWYLGLVSDFRRQRTVIICSNLEKEETAFCESKIFIGDFKPSGKKPNFAPPIV